MNSRTKSLVYILSSQRIALPQNFFENIVFDWLACGIVAYIEPLDSKRIHRI